MALCAQIVNWAANEAVTLDFLGVVQMSPSFTNALFFNLLHQMGVDRMRETIRIENAAPYILDAVNTAIARKLEKQADLTAYLTPA